MMKLIKNLLVLFLLVQVVSLPAQSFRQQKAFFPKGIKKMKVYLGASEARLLDRCSDCEDQEKGVSFRRVYLASLDDPQFQSVVFYVSTEKAEVYEMILIAKNGVDVNRVANDLLGAPTTQDKEWRFSPRETGQDFTLAAWTYKNKLIIAGDLAGSEWEPGFE